MLHIVRADFPALSRLAVGFLGPPPGAPAGGSTDESALLAEFAFDDDQESIPYGMLPISSIECEVQRCSGRYSTLA